MPKRLIEVDETFDNLMYWVERTVNNGNANSDITQAYEEFTGYGEVSKEDSLYPSKYDSPNQTSRT